MGGKKKTKWRKLPLEEFTKEIPAKPDKVPQEDACQADLTSEESSYIPSYNETVEIAQQYIEPYEYSDGLWYPTSCVVYNPAEFGLYSNYMMPVDTCYYYYTMPDMQPMQDYVTVPFQEFSQLPKDTVYLLLPPQTVRPPQPAPSIVPEWPNRRRRRRYEGYADYAVIPEKTHSNKAEEKDRNKRNGQYVNSRRNSNQSNNFRRMTSFSEPNNFDSNNSVSEQNQSSSKLNEMKKTSVSSVSMNNGKNQSSINEMDSTENNQKLKKNLEICGIHSKAVAGQKDSQTVTENSGSTALNIKNELHPDMDFNSTDIVNKQNTFSDDLVNISDSSQCCDYENNLLNESLSLENEKSNINKPEEQRHKIEDVNVPLKEIPENISSLQNINQEINSKTKPSTLEEEIPKEFSLDKELLNTSTEDIPETNSQSSLPDILSTLNKSVANEKVRDSDLSTSRPASADLDKGISFKSKSLLSQTSYLPNLLSSEALHNEMELELKQLNSLHSLQANQSIYKLAYDENVTDQSEADSRSPSPMDPESHVPTSLTSAEILIHEADSGSEAGSEDVELIPHRYESETFLNENKHVYINRLSLAVELLRTQESLPYDDEFKRVVGENNVLPGVHSGGKVNLGFVEDSNSPPPFTITNHYKNNNTSLNNKTEVVSQCQLKHSANSSSDSAIFSDIGFENLDDELCEPAKEVAIQSSESQDNTEEIRAGYRRFGVQARHYLSPRAALPFNPCFCCIVM